MKMLILATALFAVATLPAAAQSANESGETPAIATPDSTNPTAPIAGENSFTEDQAKKRITDAGYAEVSTLVLDGKGVWRGTAMKGGQSVKVGLDYQGNIVSD
ncbi:PepSY domain-containing protein [Rhizobium sp. KVB221]|uniref:PepSY domain-containing protein n=1 Tax=Rhizobium setariae TaxID=2801340 RepID=A0A936YRF7_9HYPH|nr:PepSY domain-containing protein [Rhizobium setariae]MBL0375479.1 PepSY domain-containing protein [Rhizobium setariae]